jgi:hypothetical protein
MDVLVFKTNIRYKKHVAAISTQMNSQPEISRWNVDLKDRDKILRIETGSLQPFMIEKLVRKAGHYCEELKD